MDNRLAWSAFAGMALLLSACGDSAETGASASEEANQGEVTAEDTALSHPESWPGAWSNFSKDLYDPIKAGEEAPDGFRQVLQRDWINPVYNPTFVAGDQIQWPDEELVIGVDIDGEARAYPVGFLNRREIVLDMHRGIPTFVTW